jgi:hypothetical protein
MLFHNPYFLKQRFAGRLKTFGWQGQPYFFLCLIEPVQPRLFPSGLGQRKALTTSAQANFPQIAGLAPYLP